MLVATSFTSLAWTFVYHCNRCTCVQCKNRKTLRDYDWSVYVNECMSSPENAKASIIWSRLERAMRRYVQVKTNSLKHWERKRWGGSRASSNHTQSATVTSFSLGHESRIRPKDWPHWANWRVHLVGDQWRLLAPALILLCTSHAIPALKSLLAHCNDMRTDIARICVS